MLTSRRRNRAHRRARRKAAEAASEEHGTAFFSDRVFANAADASAAVLLQVGRGRLRFVRTAVA